jgi:hypothetical protein
MALGVLFSGGTPVRAQVQNSGVPASWRSYAELVGRQFQAWLMGDDEEAYRLHKFLEDQLISKRDVPPPPLLVKVWIDHEGQVSRLDFSSLGGDQADADLRHLLTAQPLSEPPPSDMGQPLTIRLKILPKS